jgi:hypothetical protein
MAVLLQMPAYKSSDGVATEIDEARNGRINKENY